MTTPYPTPKPNLLAALPDIAEHLSRPKLALFFDIDGTISKIAPSPELAVVDPRCKAALDELALNVGLLAFVSGRSAGDAAALVGIPQAIYAGAHGLDRWESGRYSVHPDAAAAASTMQLAVERIRMQLTLPGIVIEDKGVSFAVHYRETQDPDDARVLVLQAATAVASELPVLVMEGRRVVELKPLLELNKGTAVVGLLNEQPLQGALYVGDDVTDMAAMYRLRQWSEETGVWAASVAVLSDETPAGLLDAADYWVQGVDGVAMFLTWLAENRASI